MDTMLTYLTIPYGLKFEHLNLARDPQSGALLFDRAVINAVCNENGLDSEAFLTMPQVKLAAVLAAWYVAACHAGAACDPVAEQLLTNIADEALPSSEGMRLH